MYGGGPSSGPNMMASAVNLSASSSASSPTSPGAAIQAAAAATLVALMRNPTANVSWQAMSGAPPLPGGRRLFVAGRGEVLSFLARGIPAGDPQSGPALL